VTNIKNNLKKILTIFVIGWLRQALESENTSTLNEAFCKVCKIDLRAHHADLKKHSTTNKHIQNFQRLNPARKTLDTFVAINVTSEQKERDLRLAAYIATHTSIRSVDHLTEVISQTNKIDLKLHRTKCAGLIKNVIAPCLLEELVKDLQDVPFSFIIDESTDKSTVKYLCICVKYHSKVEKSIKTNFLGILSLENATADTLYECITEFCVNNKINLNNMIGLGTDGANNLCGKHHSLFTLLKKSNDRLQLVRCVCHSLNNASSKAAEELPANIDFLCREIFSWFQHSSNRKIDYRKTWDLININENQSFHQFVQLAPTRWLSRYVLKHVTSVIILIGFIADTMS
jgi:hypothetical protein